MFSSEKMDWTTPKELFKKLDDEFNFTLDPASTHKNALCKKHYTFEDDGLKQDWGGETVYCNPPYGREVKHWVKKCFEESLKDNTTVVLLIFARTDTKYFHDYIYGKAELRFIKGRLKFGNCKNAAPFPSMIVVFKNNKKEK
jgi:phage N-6-adenine-methyltransferase